MSEKKFWRTTPAVLNSLSAVHFEITNPSPKQQIASCVEDLPFEI